MTSSTTKRRPSWPRSDPDLATTRTLMAADRTLMAWIRTSLSLLSFGFTIYKILQGFAESGALGRLLARARATWDCSSPAWERSPW